MVDFVQIAKVFNVRGLHGNIPVHHLGQNRVHIHEDVLDHRLANLRIALENLDCVEQLVEALEVRTMGSLVELMLNQSEGGRENVLDERQVGGRLRELEEELEEAIHENGELRVCEI